MRRTKRVVDTPEPSHADADPSKEDRDAGGDDSLKDLAREQQDLARERLSGELGRDPTEDEIDDWLRRQTEGY
jgi:DNA-directed RNA polymerase specialized sigma subunit